jgi:hypothetical protein
LTLLASLSLSIKTRISSTLTGPYHYLATTIYLDIPNHGPSLILDEFNANLSDAAAGTGTTEDFDDAGVLGGILFDVFDCTVKSRDGRTTCCRDWGFRFLCFGLGGYFWHGYGKEEIRWDI